MQVFNNFNQKLVQLINNGSVGVLPTDTVYGLACKAADEVAVKRLYNLKSRDHKPGTIIAASIDQLVKLGIKYRYLKAVEQFWPGAVSVEIPHHLDYLTQKTGRQAFRIPDDKKLISLLQETGPLQTTSANHTGEPPASTITKAQKYFGDTIDFYVNGGNLADRQPSTIIRIVDDAVEVIRPGAVKISETGKIEP